MIADIAGWALYALVVTAIGIGSVWVFLDIMDRMEKRK